MLYLGVDTSTGLLVSIKEVSVHRMAEISDELVLYNQLTQNELMQSHFLQLYQTNING